MLVGLDISEPTLKGEVTMKFDSLDIRRIILSNTSLYKPERNNNFNEKQFELKQDYKQVLETIKSNVPTEYTEKVISECLSVLKKQDIRSYTTDMFCMVDNLSLPTCLGLNKFGSNKSYIAIYDISNTLNLILSIFLGVDLSEFESNLAKYLVNTEMSLTQFIGAFSSRWETFYDGFNLSDLRYIAPSFEGYAENCYRNYISNKFEINGFSFDNSNYSFNDIINISIRYFISKVQEYFINNIMYEKVEVANENGASIVVQSKGIDNVILASDSPNGFTPFEIQFSRYTIILEPIVIRGSGASVGEAYLQYRTENAGLLTMGYAAHS